MDPKTETPATATEQKLKTAGQIKHLEMLQAVITRMASNSFQMKTVKALVGSQVRVAQRHLHGAVTQEVPHGVQWDPTLNET